jgi:hypothetical protein
MVKTFVFFSMVVFPVYLAAQDKKPVYPQAIEDNSYFIEEAYNQEDRVVQHINNGIYSNGDSKDFEYSFTQEWPFFSQKHQLSYTIGFTSLNSGQQTGLSDILLNYRFQLTERDHFITLSPRATLILPTGDETKGIGNGAFGYQFNLPASKRLSYKWVSHANIGYTLYPGATINVNDEKNKTNLWIFNAGASIIWLVSYKLNIMFEVLHNVYNESDATMNQTILSPGFRYAIDINNLQIVPGLAIPFTIEDKDVTPGAFFYLSLEHPF